MKYYKSMIYHSLGFQTVSTGNTDKKLALLTTHLQNFNMIGKNFLLLLMFDKTTVNNLKT